MPATGGYLQNLYQQLWVHVSSNFPSQKVALCHNTEKPMRMSTMGALIQGRKRQHQDIFLNFLIYATGYGLFIWKIFFQFCFHGLESKKISNIMGLLTSSQLRSFCIKKWIHGLIVPGCPLRTLKHDPTVEAFPQIIPWKQILQQLGPKKVLNHVTTDRIW